MLIAFLFTLSYFIFGCLWWHHIIGGDKGFVEKHTFLYPLMKLPNLWLPFTFTLLFWPITIIVFLIKILTGR